MPRLPSAAPDWQRSDAERRLNMGATRHDRPCRAKAVDAVSAVPATPPASLMCPTLRDHNHACCGRQAQPAAMAAAAGPTKPRRSTPRRWAQFATGPDTHPSDAVPSAKANDTWWSHDVLLRPWLGRWRPAALPHPEPSSAALCCLLQREMQGDHAARASAGSPRRLHACAA